MRFRYTWKSTKLPLCEPRIYFNVLIRRHYIKHIVVPAHFQIHNDVRKEWVEKAVDLHRSIDQYLIDQGDEYQRCYEDTLELSNIEEVLNWPLTEYCQWLNADLTEFLNSVKDYVRCRREGIPVLKIPAELYTKYTKYLWSCKRLTATKRRVTYTEPTN